MLPHAERQPLAIFGSRLIRAVRSSPRDCAALALPFIAPLLVFTAYQPINEAWTVKTFGCGCPISDGTYRAFDANSFNAILWCIVAAVCMRGWSKALGRFALKCDRAGWSAGGAVAIVFCCLKMWAKGGWL